MPTVWPMLRNGACVLWPPLVANNVIMLQPMFANVGQQSMFAGYLPTPDLSYCAFHQRTTIKHTEQEVIRQKQYMKSHSIARQHSKSLP